MAARPNSRPGSDSESDDEITLAPSSSKKMKLEEKLVENGPKHLPGNVSQWVNEFSPDIHVGLYPWDLFGIELSCKDSLKSLKDILPKAVEACGLPSLTAELRDLAAAKRISVIYVIIELVRTFRNTDWSNMTKEDLGKLYEYICVKLADNTLDDVLKWAWGMITQIVLELLKLADPDGGGRVKVEAKKKRARSEGDTQTYQKEALDDDVKQLESVYEKMADGILNKFFSGCISSKEKYMAYLHTISDSLQGEKVKCDPDVVCESFINMNGELLFGHLTLVAEVKHQVPGVNADVQDGTMQTCWGTANQHFAQLLVCVRDSLFSRRWSEHTPGAKIPTSDTVYVFGAMVHETKIQLTCLEVSKAHLSKIVRREPKLRFSVPKDDGSKNPKSEEENCRSPSPNTDIDEESECGKKWSGKFHVSPAFDLKNIFHSETDREDFGTFVAFLVNLEHYAFLGNAVYKLSKRDMMGIP